MSETYPTKSTYQAAFDVEDEAGEAKSLEDASATYVVTSRRAGEETLFEVTDDDPAMTIEPDGETGRIRVTIAADELDWTGLVHEELRVSAGGVDLVIAQRSTAFKAVATEPLQ